MTEQIEELLDSTQDNETKMPDIKDFTSIQTLFLFVLHKYPSLTGTEIVGIIEKEIGKDWVPSPGAIYKILKKLLKDGCIEETTDLTKLSEDQKRPYKRTYMLTSCGMKFVREQTDRMLRLVGFLYDCCPEYTDSYVVTKVCKTDNC